MSTNESRSVNVAATLGTVTAVNYPVPPSLWYDRHDGLVIVGASTDLFATVTLVRPDSDGRTTSLMFFPVSPDKLRSKITSALDSLTGEQWQLVENNQSGGRDAFATELKASFENQTREEELRASSGPSSGVSRASKLRLHTSTPGFHDSGLSVTPTWTPLDPDQKPKIVIHSKRTNDTSPSLLEQITVSVPFGVLLTGDEAHTLHQSLPTFTASKQFCSELVGDLAALEPSMKAVIDKWKRGGDNLTQGDVERHIYNMVEADLRARVKFNSTELDFVEQGGAPNVETSRWRVQTAGRVGKPSLRLRLTGGEASNFSATSQTDN